MMAYERLPAWKMAHEFAVAVSRTTESLPKSELSEGSAKRGSREFRRFLDVAIGSFAEVSYALVFARDVDLLAQADYDRLEQLRVRVGKVPWGLSSAIAKQTRKAPRQLEA
jgi:hypothetical protein